MNKEKSISFPVQLKEKEFVQAALYSQRKAMLVTTIFTIIIFIIYFFILTDLSSSTIMLLSLFCALLLFLPVLLFVVSIKEKREFRSNYQLREEVVYEVSHQGILLSTNKEDGPIGWNQFRSVKELKQLISEYIQVK